MAKPRFYLKNWMDFIHIDMLKSQIKGRTVYTWDDREYDNLTAFLKEKGIEVQGTVKDKPELITEENYIIVALSWRAPEVMVTLLDAGLKENEDFTYIGVYTQLSAISGYYKDRCGNEIICEEELENVNIELQGYNNRLFIGKGFGCEKDCIIRLKGNARLHLGRHIYARGGKMYLRNSETIFEGNSYIADNFFISNFEGTMKIGKGMTVTDGLYICVVENTTLTVGEDCLVAKDVKLLSGGAHSLFDLDLKENINIKENVHVTIGNHVWLGMGSKVIYNTDLGDCCVVGAGSLVKGSYPSHSLIAGSVARILRTNVDWDHDDYVTFPEYEELMEKRRKLGL